MEILLTIILALAAGGLVWLGMLLWIQKSRFQALQNETAAAQAQFAAKTIAVEAAMGHARTEARRIHDNARQETLKATHEAQSIIQTASLNAAEIISKAEKQAVSIAGSAFDALRNADENRRTAQAMKNIIDGYGDRYLTPPASLLDELADDFSHKDAGQSLKAARSNTRNLIKNGAAARCEYVDSRRREGAESFVLDAFNGKVDSILSRVREDNAGKLEQEIQDAFTLVNYGGRAFRDARITEEYLQARLDELRWATVAQQLRQEEQEEQRRVREQMREEEKARREYERTIRDAEKEEDVLRKAMAKAEAQIAEATAEQRAKYEQQLADLGMRLKDAEERNQRALSMAQQTKKGFVYVISNIGSFGDNVYKIGLTRRLEPLDRVRELGDSSVPFEFDVHALILSDDAPALECKLHQHFVLNQVNKMNYRKEFFRTTVSALRKEIETLGIEAKWTMTAESREFRETQVIEKAIASDPAAREKWVNRQLVLEPLDFAAEPEPDEVKAR